MKLKLVMLATISLFLSQTVAAAHLWNSITVKINRCGSRLSHIEVPTKREVSGRFLMAGFLSSTTAKSPEEISYAVDHGAPEELATWNAFASDVRDAINAGDRSCTIERCNKLKDCVDRGDKNCCSNASYLAAYFVKDSLIQDLIVLDRDNHLTGTNLFRTYVNTLSQFEHGALLSETDQVAVAQAIERWQLQANKLNQLPENTTAVIINFDEDAAIFGEQPITHPRATVSTLEWDSQPYGLTYFCQSPKE